MLVAALCTKILLLRSKEMTRETRPLTVLLLKGDKNKLVDVPHDFTVGDIVQEYGRVGAPWEMRREGSPVYLSNAIPLKELMNDTADGTTSGGFLSSDLSLEFVKKGQ